jgi:hypothetical protein
MTESIFLQKKKPKKLRHIRRYSSQVVGLVSTAQNFIGCVFFCEFHNIDQEKENYDSFPSEKKVWQRI